MENPPPPPPLLLLQLAAAHNEMLPCCVHFLNENESGNFLYVAARHVVANANANAMNTHASCTNVLEKQWRCPRASNVVPAIIHSRYQSVTSEGYVT